MSLNLGPKGPQGGAAANAAQPGDYRARLRAAREQLAKGSTKRFVLPGYDADNPVLGGALIVRYRRLLADELTEAFRYDRWADESGKMDFVAANAQFLIDACVDMTIRDDQGDHPLVPGHETTYTINLDSGESLASIMGVDHITEARDQLVAIFGDNELVLNEHSEEVHRWMVSANSADGDQALGEA